MTSPYACKSMFNLLVDNDNIPILVVTQISSLKLYPVGDSWDACRDLANHVTPFLLYHVDHNSCCLFLFSFLIAFISFNADNFFDED